MDTMRLFSGRNFDKHKSPNPMIDIGHFYLLSHHPRCFANTPKLKALACTAHKNSSLSSMTGVEFTWISMPQTYKDADTELQRTLKMCPLTAYL